MRRMSRVTADDYDDDARLRPTAGAVPDRVMINDYEEINRMRPAAAPRGSRRRSDRGEQQQILYFSISGRRRRSLTTRSKLTRPR